MKPARFCHRITLVVLIFFTISTPTLCLAQSNDQLPLKQIEKFVTTISLIKNYYVKEVTDKQLFDNAIGGMLKQLDPHSAYLSPEEINNLKIASSGQFAGIGVEISPENGLLKVISPLDGAPAKKAGIKPGDIIIKIGSKLIQDMQVNQAINQIRGKKGSQVELTILRKGLKKPLTLRITRDTIKITGVKSRLLAPHYGYIRIGFFQDGLKKELIKAISELKTKSNNQLWGVTLDLRDNPGGLLDAAIEVSDCFLNRNQLRKYNGVIVSTKGRVKSADMTVKAKPNDLIMGVPMVVLINSGSASGSEIVAGALQDYNRAIIMGTRSFGKGSVQSVLPISNDSAIKLTTALYFTPSGRSIQAQGIEPDTYVPQLKIASNSNQSALTFHESEYNQHIQTPNQPQQTTETKQTLQQKQALQKNSLKLATTDYQLYESLLVLKSLHINQKTN